MTYILWSSDFVLSWLTMTYFTAKSSMLHNAFIWENTTRILVFTRTIE